MKRNPLIILFNFYIIKTVMGGRTLPIITKPRILKVPLRLDAWRHIKFCSLWLGVTDLTPSRQLKEKRYGRRDLQ